MIQNENSSTDVLSETLSDYFKRNSMNNNQLIDLKVKDKDGNNLVIKDFDQKLPKNYLPSVVMCMTYPDYKVGFYTFTRDLVIA